MKYEMDGKKLQRHIKEKKQLKIWLIWIDILFFIIIRSSIHSFVSVPAFQSMSGSQGDRSMKSCSMCEDGDDMMGGGLGVGAGC